jgi:hypothetical protein
LLFSGAASAKDTVDFRFPERSYTLENLGWEIYVEKSMESGNPDLYRESLAKLRETLEYTFSSMPKHARERLSDLKFFLMWGESSPQGGRKSSMNYIRKGQTKNYSHLDQRWGHAVVIYSAENLMYLNELWARKALFHELAHAWHIVNWPEKHPHIYKPWKQAIAAKKYENVMDLKGKTIKKAYAVKNQLEYFAELSAIYFVGGNYFPYDKSRLKDYDPSGFNMVKGLWE